MIYFLLGLFVIFNFIDGNEKLKLDEHDVKDKEHLSGHAKGENMKKPVNEMTDDELEFFYFHEHDKDHNKLLDGNEVFMSVIEHMEHDHRNQSDNASRTAEDKFSEVEIKSFITNIMEYDKNNDGYLDLNEFRKIYKAKED